MRDCQILSKKIVWVGGLLCIISTLLWAQPFAGGSGEPNDPYQIATAEQLVAMGEDPNGWDLHYQLVNDIDLSTYVFDRAVIATTLLDTESLGFSGKFDGQGYAIHHLNIRASERQYCGLFGCLYLGGEIANLEVNDVTIISYSASVGGLVGINHGTISNSSCAGCINGSRRIGGLVGVNSNTGSIQSCISECQVRGVTYVGGLVGYNNGDITACSSESQVKGEWSVGGLVGNHFRFGSLSLSVSKGQVAGELDVGGLVGDASGDIIYCYNLSQVSGKLFDIGGVVGYCSSSITQCFNAGPVSGPQCGVGGLVGDENKFVFEDFDSCFWDVEVSGQPDRLETGMGLTTAQMQDIETFEAAGWKFVDEGSEDPNAVWWMPEEGYPRLSWERD